MTLGFIVPCGMNTPQVHNRATELSIAVQGRLVASFVAENGVVPVANTLSSFQMTVFPQAAIHTEFSPDCDDAVFVAAFNSEDPGVEQIAESLFSLKPAVVAATLGGVSVLDGRDFESFRRAIPANVASGIEACINRCGLERNAKRDDFFRNQGLASLAPSLILVCFC